MRSGSSFFHPYLHVHAHSAQPSPTESDPDWRDENHARDGPSSDFYGVSLLASLLLVLVLTHSPVCGPGGTRIKTYASRQLQYRMAAKHSTSYRSLSRLFFCHALRVDAAGLLNASPFLLCLPACMLAWPTLTTMNHGAVQTLGQLKLEGRHARTQGRCCGSEGRARRCV